jgi:hypothetical protein
MTSSAARTGALRSEVLCRTPGASRVDGRRSDRGPRPVSWIAFQGWARRPDRPWPAWRRSRAARCRACRPSSAWSERRPLRQRPPRAARSHGLQASIARPRARCSRAPAGPPRTGRGRYSGDAGAWLDAVRPLGYPRREVSGKAMTSVPTDWSSSVQASWGSSRSGCSMKLQVPLRGERRAFAAGWDGARKVPKRSLSMGVPQVRCRGTVSWMTLRRRGVDGAGSRFGWRRWGRGGAWRSRRRTRPPARR